jgi:hypothetical protein
MTDTPTEDAKPSNREPWLDRAIDFIGECAIELPVTAIGVGFLVVGYDAYKWLRFGAWAPTSLMDVLTGLEKAVGYQGQWSWLHFPTDWLGVHSLLTGCPLSLGLVVGGFVSFVFSFVAFAQLDEWLKAYRAAKS